MASLWRRQNPPSRRQPNQPPRPFTQCDYATQIGRLTVSGRRDDEFTQYAESRIGSLRRVAFLLCQDWQRADDLVQVAITRLYVHWGRASAVEHTDAYVRTILVREFLAEQRSGWARRVSLDGSVPDLPGAVPDLAAALDVRAALAALPPRQRATVVLRFYCDLNVDQAAQVLGCSTGTVKSQTAKGLSALRRALGPELSESAGLRPEPPRGPQSHRREAADHG